jgi:hypothetical protein
VAYRLEKCRFDQLDDTSKRSHTRVLNNARMKKPGSMAGLALLLLGKVRRPLFCWLQPRISQIVIRYSVEFYPRAIFIFGG